MLDLYDRLFPPDDPKSQRKWRATIGNAIFGLLLFAVFTTWAMIWDIPKLGSLAWAGDVDKKVASAVLPVESRVTRVERTVAETAQTTKLLLARLSMDQIDQLVKRRCKSRDEDEIAYLSREVRRYQDDYRVNRGEIYNAPTCEEVGFKERAK